MKYRLFFLMIALPSVCLVGAIGSIRKIQEKEPSDVAVWEEYDVANGKIKLSASLIDRTITLAESNVETYPLTKAGDNISITRKGLPLYVWAGTNFETKKLSLYAMALKEDGTWTDRVQLSDDKEDISFLVQIVVGGTGQVTAIWTSYNDESPFLEMRASTAIGDNWTHPVTLQSISDSSRKFRR